MNATTITEICFMKHSEPGTDSIHAAKAIAQFLRTMVSTNSKYDKFLRGEAF